VPDQIAGTLCRHFGNGAPLIVRSSSNCEDLPEMAGAGLYESVANVAVTGLASAVRTVWGSLWTRRAALSRRQAGIPHAEARMAVLIQEMLAPDWSFVLHTTNPVNGDPRELYAEVAVGLGEALASAAIAGNPYRFGCDKESGALRTLAFANFSQALRPVVSGAISSETLDYSRVPLSSDAQARRELATRLARIGRNLEQALGAPQDIEGAVVDGEIYLVQARPQVGMRGKDEG
jgi:phosphoglucan,water dikinase